jgi:hypothetical protein
MKNQKSLINPIRLFLLCNLVFLLGSCQSYRYGYWGKLDDSGSSSVFKSDSAKQVLEIVTARKQQLVEETFILSKEITEQEKNSVPVSMHTFNTLFSNLHEQYEIDTIYHRLFQESHDDSIRQKSKLALLESAVNYKKAFQKNKFLRRAINRGDLAYGIPTQTLMKTQQFLWSEKANRHYLVEHEKDKKAIHTKTGFFFSRSSDKCHSYTYKTVYFFSKIFGNFFGQFHGKIDRKTNSMFLQSQLQEFDIVWLKSITHLTERFIPGYFGHVGVCLGNNLMVEAKRSGTKLSSIEEFSDGEIFLIARPKELSETQKQKIRLMLKSQVGKKYDFNFDSQSPDRIICSDLICLSYDFVEWQTKKRGGHFNTSPDDLVRSLLTRSDFNFELYLNQGQFVNRPDSGFIQELLKKK